MTKTRLGQTYIYYPCMFDKLQGVKIKPGQRVKTTQPRGCPPNNTMGQSYVANMQGKFLQMVANGSLYTKADYEQAQSDRFDLSLRERTDVTLPTPFD